MRVCSVGSSRRIAGLAAAIVGVAALTVCAGCIVHVQLPAAAVRVDHAPQTASIAPEPDRAGDLDWPARWGDETGRRGVIVPLEGPASTWNGVWLGEHHFLRAAETEYADAAVLGEAFDVPEGFKFRTEGPGAYIFARDPRYEGPDADPVPGATPRDPALFFKYVSGTVRTRWSRVEGVEIQRTWFGVYDPIGRPADQTRGTIVLLPGMFGTPEPVIESVIASMRARGWSVVRMYSHPSRFTERLEVPIDPDAPERAGATLAAALTDRAAECAYATEAALEHARSHRPELAERPTVLLGMSGGAIALSTVHAWRPDLYDGAILVAGGVNFLRINAESNYASFIDAVHLDWTPYDDTDDAKPTRAQLDELCDAYLQRAPLDGWFLAERLRGKPALIIHGSTDRAVPAHLGDELWRRAGEPERWTFPFGHELVFLALPTQAARIDAWLRDNIEHDPHPSPEPSPDQTP